MWLMTQHGFYSIVEKTPDEFHIRSRERGDLQNLIDRVPLPLATIEDSPKNDYAFRIIGKRELVALVLQFMASSLDYGNFKDHIDRSPDQKRKSRAYHEVWGVMAGALGSYGRAGSEMK